MDPKAIYRKTGKGEEEIRTRSAKLPPKLRTMLILVDGVKPYAELLRVAQQLGAGDNFAKTLADVGLIEAAGGAQPAAAPKDEFERFRAAKRFMNDTAVNALGVRSFFFTLKVEKCGNREDLVNLMEDYEKALGKGFEPGEAAVLAQQMRELLA